MSRKPVDFVTLDALVQGEDDPETPEAWRALLATPDAATRWAQAVTQRETIDRFAMEVLSHPWLASALSRLRRKTRFPSGVALRVHLEPPPLTALLGPTVRAPELLTAPAWGDIESLSVKVGLTLEIHPYQAPGEHVRVFYQSRTSQGWMPGRRWKLEPGESPVLLMAVEGADTADTLDTALSKSPRAAGIVLFEIEEDAPED
ncbi:hypothetical protein [Pyxidicoccus sp. MSG2]|uniref:hypothetical protein n=1 Tax=Pyxidicoccus sp. MSG2 TaxID=2996790 RepID=UPI00226F4C09|nr:hypothetical protein [Pyxidicoccus sp. MSG2]MCY1021717.1 hypothetical protein [Pyxidicoccus sp. MSG2]